MSVTITARRVAVALAAAAVTAGVMVVSAPPSAARIPAGTCQGLIQVTNATTNTPLGYLGASLVPGGVYTYSTDSSTYLVVSFVPGTQQNITTFNGPAAPNDHLILQSGSPGSVLAAGSLGYTYLAGGSTSPAGSTPSASGSSTWTPPNSTNPIESAVWNTSSLSSVTATWINPGGAAGPTHFFYDQTENLIGATGDLAALGSAFPGITLVPLALSFDGLCNLPTTTTLVGTPTSPALDQSTTFTATVHPTLGTLTPTGTVTFEDHGTGVATVPLVNGQATYTAAYSPSGHSIQAFYSGDNNYQVSQSNTVATTSPCTTTYTGAHGPVYLTSGGGCVSSATVAGNVDVTRAAADIENSSVSGSVLAARPAAIRICGSTITGDVTIDAATGPVVIGDRAHGCAANVIHGRVTVVNSTGRVMIVGNTITGHITTTGDTGTLTISGNHT